MTKPPLLQVTDKGLYCQAGDFYVDPWEPVERAVITHAHSDHARIGTSRYLAAAGNELILRTRLGPDAVIETVPYGKKIDLQGCYVSLHPAGHILGSAQVRVESSRGEVWVVSGDYKMTRDDTCAQFEPVQCHTFITEATFALPVYRWRPDSEIFAQINSWWKNNQQRGKASVLYCYALGKAQRILAGIDEEIGPIFTHGAVERLNEDYRQSGVLLPPTKLAGAAPRKTDWSKALILAPPSAMGTPWLRRFGSIASGFASGWMIIRGMRRRKAIDRGFILSDHSDWSDLLSAINQSSAERVLVTHGYVPILVRYLQEQGIDAAGLSTRFEGEQLETDTHAIATAREQTETESAEFVSEDEAIEAEMVAHYTEGPGS
jgi:putative mRNA 3-end processing factor